MSHLGKPYYVGVLSAAAIHGASHQQPMEFQVVTKGPLRDILLPGVRIHFFAKRNIHEIKTTKVKTKTGYMNTSTPEVTAFDLVKYVERAGYLDNVVNVLIELSPKLRSRHLAATAKFFESTVVQRLGYLLDTYVGQQSLTQTMHEHLKMREPQTTPLSLAGQPNKGDINSKWLVWVNETVEPDI
jgi:predicted transcriptional regulator of viral defense system